MEGKVFSNESAREGMNRQYSKNFRIAKQSEEVVVNSFVVSEANGRQESRTGFLEQIIDRLADGICVFQVDTKHLGVDFLLWNNSLLKITGFSADDLDGFKWTRIFTGQSQKLREITNFFKQVINSEKGATANWEIENQETGSKYLEVTASNLYSDGSVSTIVTMFTDITQRKKNELLLMKENEQLNKLNASKDKFFSILAHDLKNPFGAILGLSDLLEEAVAEKDHEQVKHFSGVLNRGVKKSYALLENLLEWSKAQQHKLEFKPEWLNASSILDSTVEVMEDMAKNKNVKLESEVVGNVIAYADRNMLRTVIRNLISNAIKYSFPGDVVKIFLSAVGNDVYCSVKDNGVGISDAIKSRLFRIDENVTTYGTENESGTGIGLLLCKEFVEYHGGKIWIESTENNGAEFHFKIPGKMNAHEYELERKESVDSEVKVLIAEDEEINYLLLKALLKPTECKVLRAHNGSEAIDICVKNPDVNVVLMDIKMPVMDGVTATRKIKEVLPDIPVVAQTAYDLTSDSREVFQGYISKPIDKSILFNTIGRYICPGV